MNTVSVRVSYRPIRVAWCIAEGSIEDFRKAVRLSTTLWGGRFNPIISVGRNPKHADTLSRTFRVDALHALSKAPEVTQFVERASHLPWPDFDDALFVQGAGGSLPTLLDVYHPLHRLSAEREKQKQPALDGAYVRPNLLTRFKADGDVLADVMLATLGDYPDRDYCPVNYGRFAEHMLGVDYLELKPGTAIPDDYWKRLSPIVASEEGLLVYKRRGGWDTGGVFIGDPASFSDLVTFWNLRAANIEILFFPEKGDERLLTATQKWMTEVKAFLAEDKPNLVDVPALWCGQEKDCSAYTQIFESGYSPHRLSDGTWNGSNIRPPRVHFEEQSVLGTIDEEDGNIAIAFPLPTKPFLDAPETSSEHAIASIRLPLDPNPAVGTFRLPYIPQLNQFYGRSAHFDRSSARVEQEGVGIVVTTQQSDLRLSGVSPFALITEVFRLAGITAKQSAAGIVALRVIRHMGGPDRCRVFKIRGVRDLLREFSASKAFSHKQALAWLGRSFDRYKRLFIEPREHRDLTPQDVFLHLVKKKVIRPGVELHCLNCLLREWHSLNDLAEQVDCPYCGAEIDSGPQLRDDAWHYRVSGLFARTRDQEGAIPVTLTLMQVLRCLRGRSTVWFTGTDMTWTDEGRDTNGETDLVALGENDSHEPELLIGECKTNKELEVDQIDKLIAAARRFAGTGIRPYILFAKAGGPFSDDELELIDARQTIDLNFILLTPTELEPYDPYENVAADKIRRRTPRTLREWASYSHVLYLKTQPDKIWERHWEASTKAAG